MIKNEIENKEFNERIFDLVRIAYRKRPGATVSTVTNIIEMSAQGKLYTRNDIQECIMKAVELGYLYMDPNGKILAIAEKGSNLELNKENENDVNEKRRKFAEGITVHKQDLELKAQKEAENKNNTAGFHLSSRRNEKGRY